VLTNHIKDTTIILRDEKTLNSLDDIKIDQINTYRTAQNGSLLSLAHTYEQTTLVSKLMSIPGIEI
jgi:hypothetical protein